MARTPSDYTKVFKEAIDTYLSIPALKGTLEKMINEGVDIYAYLFALAKQESNFNPSVKSFDSYNTEGIFHVLPSRRLSTIKTYQSNAKKQQEIYKQTFTNQVSETFMVLRLTCLSYEKYKKNGLKVKRYIEFRDSLPESLRTPFVLFLLHNSEAGLTVESSQFYPPITHSFTALLIYSVLAKKTLIQSIALVPPAIQLLEWLFGVSVLVASKTVLEKNQKTFNPYADLVSRYIPDIKAKQRVTETGKKLGLKISTLINELNKYYNVIQIATTPTSATQTATATTSTATTSTATTSTTATQDKTVSTETKPTETKPTETKPTETKQEKTGLPFLAWLLKDMLENKFKLLLLLALLALEKNKKR